MFIQFSLGDVSRAVLIRRDIMQQLEEWKQRYHCDFRHKTVWHKQQDAVLRVTFDSDELYDFFSLTWLGEPFRLIP